MRNAVFFSSGLGNAILLIPLLKELKGRGEVVVFCTSEANPEKVFNGFLDPPIDRFVPLRDKPSIFRAALRFKSAFDVMYLDHFATTPKILAFSKWTARKVCCVPLPENAAKICSGRVECHLPVVGDHEAVRYLKLAVDRFQNEDLDENHFALRTKPAVDVPKGKYFTVQPGSGGNAAPWKNLPPMVWAKVAELLLQAEPEARVVLLGDASEKGLSQFFPDHPRMDHAFGTLALERLPALIQGAEMHLGGDSFLMHLAGCVQTPSFTVWGGSDPNMYGWHRFAPHRHGTLHESEPCAPCSRWLKPNTSRVVDPFQCPDYRCMGKYSAEAVMESFNRFRNSFADV